MFDRVRKKLSQNWQHYALLGLIVGVALVSRLFELDVFLTADEPKSWFGRAIQFLTALTQGDWQSTFDSPAPGVTTMWAGSLGLLLAYAQAGFPGDLPAFLAAVPFDPLDPAILPLIRLPGVLIGVLAAALTYLWGRPLVGSLAAGLAGLFYALDPFMLALTRILGHDALVSTFMWLSLLAFLRALHQPPEGQLLSRRYLVISGLLGGLAFITKYPSLFLGAFLAGVMLILHLQTAAPLKQKAWHWLRDVALWSLAAGLIGFVLWPALWVDLFGRVNAILSDAFRASGSPHQKGSFFLGEIVADPGLSFYLIVTLFKTTVVLWLGWLLAGWAAFQQQDKAWRRLALILLAYTLLFGLLVSVGGKKQDRYILPVFPALAMLASLGYAWFVQQKLRQRATQGLLLGAILLAQVGLVAPHFPYFFTYYNPVLGGGQVAAQTMIIGWGEGLDEAARWLNAQPTAENIDVVSWYSTTFEPFFAGNAIYEIEDEKISRSAKPGLAAEYVIFYVNQLQRDQPSPGALQHFQAVDPAHVVRLHGIDYAWIYPSLQMQTVIANEARLVGQAEWQGFNVVDEAGQALPNLTATETAMVQVYWEWQGKSPDEPIGLSLVDENGETWGWGNPLGIEARLPFEQWQEGMVARNDFALVVFPGTPPGDYYLASWIDRPATGEVVGQFPLDLNSVRLRVERPDTPPDISQLGLSDIFSTPVRADVTLLGLDRSGAWDSAWGPHGERELSLFWQATAEIIEPPAVTLSLHHAELGQQMTWTAPLFNGAAWQPGDVTRQPWYLTLPPYVPPGPYQLKLTLAEGETITLLETSVEGRERSFALPEPNLPLTATFENGLLLLGGQTEADALSVSAGQPLEFSLFWQTPQVIEDDYTLTVQLLDANNEVRAQRDGVPLDGSAPTSTWTPGEVLLDPIRLDVPPEIGPGPHRLLLAFYRPDTGARLLLDSGADHISLPLE